MHSGTARQHFEQHDRFVEMVEIVGGKPGRRIDIGVRQRAATSASVAVRSGACARLGAILILHQSADPPQDLRCSVMRAWLKVQLSDMELRSQRCADATASPLRRRRSGRCFAIASSRISRRATTWRRPSRCRSCGWSRASAQFALVRWGLIPAWVKDPQGFTLLINARGESVERQAGVPQRHEAPPLPVSGRRLLRMEARTATASGRISCGRRRAGRSPSPACGKPGPGRTARRWKPPRSSPRAPTATIAPIHDRMPVIVPPEAFDLWLDCRRSMRRRRRR